MRRIIGEATAFAFVAVLRFPRNSPADARLRRLLRIHWRQRPYCLQRSAMMEAMKIDLSDEVVKLIVEALEHYCAGCEYSSFNVFSTTGAASSGVSIRNDMRFFPWNAYQRLVDLPTALGVWFIS